MNFINLRISGEGLALDEITKTIGITPKHAYKKGEKSFYKGNEVRYEEDCWIAVAEIENTADTEQELINFVHLLCEHAEDVKALSRKHVATLWVTIYQDETQYNLHVSSDIMRKLSEMGVSLDVTCMQLQEYY